MQTVIHPGLAICREHFRIAALVKSPLRSAESVNNCWKEEGTGLITIRIPGNAMLRPGWQLSLLWLNTYRLLLALSRPIFAGRRMTISTPLRVLLVAGMRMHWLRSSCFQRGRRPTSGRSAISTMARHPSFPDSCKRSKFGLSPEDPLGGAGRTASSWNEVRTGFIPLLSSEIGVLSLGSCVPLLLLGHLNLGRKLLLSF